jgi:hypothetical protein
MLSKNYFGHDQWLERLLVESTHVPQCGCKGLSHIPIVFDAPRPQLQTLSGKNAANEARDFVLVRVWMAGRVFPGATRNRNIIMEALQDSIIQKCNGS